MVRYCKGTSGLGFHIKHPLATLLKVSGNQSQTGVDVGT